VKTVEMKPAPSAPKAQPKDQRFRISLSGSGYLPFNIFEPDAEAKKRAYFDASVTDTALSLPEKGVEFSGTLRTSLRAAGPVWMSAQLVYARTRTKETSVVFLDTVARSLVIGSGPIVGDIPVKQWRRTRTYENFLDLGVGLDIDFVRTARVQFGMSLAPEIGLAFVHLSDYHVDSSYAVLGAVPYPTYLEVVQTTVSGDLTSLTLGGLGGLDFEFLFTPHFGLRADLAASWKAAPWLQGLLDGRTRTVTSISGVAPVIHDSTYFATRAAMKADYLGTGEYVDYVDPAPGAQIMPKTRAPVVPWRSFKEYADVRLSLGVVIYL
jgi:hypothetical protein